MRAFSIKYTVRIDAQSPHRKLDANTHDSDLRASLLEKAALQNFAGCEICGPNSYADGKRSETSLP